ncbi:tyrosine-type recombinase/integrase [Lacticaseibacillus rhamnosus]|uniref:tyrosine-type recombinase/integrase n=1 Tax=Lacticaseibacillus rhamnosus TaxID=47715 RepID=UPI001EF3C221|nr:tyrosine-type recombinase/integrase [Lacticaseibacillus rhamnosus]
MAQRFWKKPRNQHEEDLMFLSSTYEVPQSDSVNRRLDELHYRLGIKRIGMHGMRHTHATQLIYAGYSDWYIAKRLGHNSLKELHRTYGHVFEQMQAEADTKLRASIGQDYLGKPPTKSSR